jgi:autotransporter-associated beta strand protein
MRGVIFSVLLFTVAAGTSPSTGTFATAGSVSLTAVANGSGNDSNHDGIWDTLGDESSRSLLAYNGLPGGYNWRAAVEFDLEPIPSHVIVTRAVFRICYNGASGGPAETLKFNSYTADGAITFSDFEVDNQIGPMYNAFGPGLGSAFYEVPAGSFIQELLATDSRFAGFMIENVAWNQTSFRSMTSGPSYEPRLDVDYLPEPQWAPTHGGSYNDQTNWTDTTVPNGVGDAARFLESITARSTVTVDAPILVGTIEFDNANSYMIAQGVPGAGITLATSSGNAQIDVDGGVHTISAPLSLASNADVTVDSGNILFLSGVVSGSAGLTKMGPGVLSLSGNNTYQGPTEILAGIIQVGKNSSLGDPTALLRLDGGILRTTGAFSGTRNAIVGPGGATIDTKDTTSLTLNSPAPALATGDLIKEGTGTCVLGSGLFLLGNVNVNGGTLQVAKDLLTFGGGNVNLAEGTTLRASGTIGRRVINAGPPGTSTLEALGAMEVGDSNDPNGYNYQGKLKTGPYFVGLKDANLAQLYGAQLAGGTLSSFNGIEVQPFNPALPAPSTTVQGNGTIDGNVTLSRPGAGLAVIAGTTAPITMTGTVKGNATMINVIRTGLYSPGFNPAYLPETPPEGTVYGANMVMQLLGPTGGRIVKEPGLLNPDALVAGDFTQIYLSMEPGAAGVQVGGPFLIYTFDLNNPSDKYSPKPGDVFRLLVSGPYDASFLGGLKPAAHLTYVDPTGASLFKFDNAPLGPGLEWTWQLPSDGVTLMVVPEPGTLAPLLTGAFGLLLLWQQRRKA